MTTMTMNRTGLNLEVSEHAALLGQLDDLCRNITLLRSSSSRADRGLEYEIAEARKSQNGEALTDGLVRLARAVINAERHMEQFNAHLDYYRSLAGKDALKLAGVTAVKRESGDGKASHDAIRAQQAHYTPKAG